MGLAFAERLLKSRLLRPSDVDALLLQAFQRQVSLTQVVMEAPGLSEQLEAALAPTGVPAIQKVRALPDAVTALPEGLCQRLMAVPVRRDMMTSVVDVAAADPADTHVAAELSHHLGVPVRLLRAPWSEILAAVVALDQTLASAGLMEVDDERTPAFGTPAPAPGPGPSLGAEQSAEDELVWEDTPAPGSQPPIPLVRSKAPGWRKTTDPGAGVAERRAPAAELDGDEPVIGLFRTKAPRSQPLKPQAAARPQDQAQELEQLTRRLNEAPDPDAVVDEMARSACPDGYALVFSVRKDEFTGRASSRSGERVRELKIPVREHSVLRAAVEAGRYLGVLPETPVHAPLRALGESRVGGEVYAVSISVAGRPVLVLCVTGYQQAVPATRRADAVAAAAQAAIERLLERRKHRRGS